MLCRNNNHSPFEEHVYIVINKPLKNEADNEILRLRLPSSRLAQHSRDFRTRIEMSKSVPAHLREPIRFNSIEPRIFEIWLQWIYHHNLHMYLPSQRRKVVVRDARIDDALKAWELGKELLDPGFQDAFTDHIVKVAKEQYPPPWQYIRRIYELTNHGSGLRRLFRTMMC